MDLGIKPLAEVQKNEFRSFLYYGPGGSGKTTLAVQHPGRGLFLDIDERLHELELTSDISGRIDVWQPKVTLGSREIQFVTIDPTRKDVYNKGTQIAEEPKGFKLLVEVCNGLLRLGYESRRGGAPFPYDFVVADSLTTISAHLEYAVMYTHKVSALTQTLYDVVKRNFREWLSGFLALPCDRILIAHDKHVEKRDKDTNAILQSYTRPNAVGSFAETLITQFSECYYFVGRDGPQPNYRIQTATDRICPARTTRKAFNYVEQADPEMVYNLNWKRKESK